MKLGVIIFNFNEANTLPAVIASIPRQIDGIDSIDILVVDDGSTDNSVQVAQRAGAYVVSHATNKGLAKSFNTGTEAALMRGADIIVHTDGDNQYDQQQIPFLLRPILKGKAEVVIGNRQIPTLTFMPAGNKYGNILGNKILNYVLQLKNIDMSSGFRAYTRQSLLRLFVYAEHTYTHETIIQLAADSIIPASVPITFKERASGSSRLIKNIVSHLSRSVMTILLTTLFFRPLKFFGSAGIFLFSVGALLGARFLYFFITEGGGGHIQSLILASILITLGFSIVLLGLIADLISKNIRTNRESLYRIKKMQLDRGNTFSENK